MATRSQISAAVAQREFGSLSRSRQRLYRRAAGGASDRRSNAARHMAGMRAAGGAGSAGG